MDPSLNGNTQEGNLEKMANLQFFPPRKPMKSSMHIPVIKTDVLARALAIKIAKLKYTNRLMSARIITIGAGATSIT